MIYQKRNIEGIGEVEFLGNWGALADFEETIGKGYMEVFKEGEIPRISNIIQFVYSCYKIAQLRQGKDIELSFDQFSSYADKWVIDLYAILLKDALGVTDNEPVQKKISKASK